MKPSTKARAIEDFLDKFGQASYGRTRTDAIRGDVCAMCGKPATEFKDAKSEREYSISGMCQACQDKFYE